jgi:hypothetical protein
LTRSSGVTSMGGVERLISMRSSRWLWFYQKRGFFLKR